MQTLSILGTNLQLLPTKAVYLQAFNWLLVADVHLGKSETFQRAGIPIPNQVNQQTLDRLASLCQHFQPEQLIILGDLFHSRYALQDEVCTLWDTFLKQIAIPVQVVLGNHDRPFAQTLLSLAITCHTEAIVRDRLIFSHEPQPQPGYLNLCGHVHPCVRLQTRLDRLRLPCFYLDQQQQTLMLPSFGEFTGGYEMSIGRGAIAYVIAENTVISIA